MSLRMKGLLLSDSILRRDRAFEGGNNTIPKASGPLRMVLCWNTGTFSLTAACTSSVADVGQLSQDAVRDCLIRRIITYLGG